jgi:hypothetical protein
MRGDPYRLRRRAMGYLRDFGFEMQEFTAFEISDFPIFRAWIHPRCRIMPRNASRLLS